MRRGAGRRQRGEQRRHEQCVPSDHGREPESGGRDSHHLTEAAFKAVGLALRDALVDSGTVFSTKGSVALEVK